MRKVVLFLLVCFFCFSGSVFAIPVTFDLSGTSSANRYFDELIIPEHGISLNVKGYLSENQYSAGVLMEVTQTSSGLGVYSGGSDTGQLDDSYYDLERLSLIFSQSVTLLQFEFSYVDDEDQFSLLLDDGSFYSRDAVAVWDSDVFLRGQSFSLSILDSSDDWRIKALTVDVPVPTPEPSTWLLLSVGVGGLAYWRRRQ